MSRYGWSLNREQSYGARPGGVPTVTNDDFSYITSQELDDPGLGYSDSRHYPRSRHNAVPEPEDDVLLIKNRGVTYPAHFPAYSIGDGKLYVKDVRDRTGLLMDLSSRTTRHIKLLYKGKQLKDSSIPIRDYGVKNKSELMAVIPDVDDDSSLSGEETVIVGESSQVDAKTRPRRRRRTKKRTDRTEADSPTSPRDSDSNLEPHNSHSPAAAASGPMRKLEDISDEFSTQWLPFCLDYIESPPTDPKKREEEHRKLSESVLQQILLKLDGVEADGIAEVRTRRKELVKQVQEVLKQLDTAKASS